MRLESGSGTRSIAVGTSGRIDPDAGSPIHTSNRATVSLAIYTIAALPLADFTSARAHSMKRSTTGLMVRFFRVAIATRYGFGGRFTGSSFSEHDRATDLEWIVRNGP